MKITLGAAAGAILTAFSFGATVGNDRSEFQEAARRSVRNEREIVLIRIERAKDRQTMKQLVNMVSEVRADIKAMKEAR